MSSILFFKRYLLALLVLNLTACSSLQPVSIESAMQFSPPRGVAHGSLVEIKTLDKQRVKFRVTEINDDGLGGKPGFFRYEDMKSLRVETPGKDNGDTLAYVLGVIGAIALIALVANADSVAVCSPSPCPPP